MTEKFDEVKEVKVDYTRLRVPLGPVHPALKEPISLTVTVRREEILDVVIRLGHVHRGIEALAETRNLIQTLYLVERICGICSHSHTTGFVQALEEIGEIELSDRSLHLRSLIFELERMQSHLFLIGIMAYEIGFDTLFMFTWYEREKILDLFEEITGNRIHHSMNTLGGVRWDLSPSFVEKVNCSLNKIEKSAKYIQEVFQDKTVEKRLCGVGVLDYDEARELCVVGPTARGSGVKVDIRKAYPYAAYSELKDDFSVVLRNTADAQARTQVRILELFESINLIRAILEKLPDGPIYKESVIKLMKKIPEGEATSLVEAPRGELLYFVRTNGKEGLWRLNVRTPTIPNVLGLKPMLIGSEIADIPVTVASIDPCMACANRITVVDQDKRETIVTDLKNLRNRGKKQ
ncbi:MAG: nickel-dependent hydrogenase large subunit [Candidatus Bathyarchaeota archaeon]|nr:nickel-dependent hydrogenase large subunit [Candidatus Bathyarchaeota archaeon]MDH5787097.1 nickel-dependent hydrogenase large subunit [Candidatus Bathyarchaeota archaeon]